MGRCGAVDGVLVYFVMSPVADAYHRGEAKHLSHDKLPSCWAMGSVARAGNSDTLSPLVRQLRSQSGPLGRAAGGLCVVWDRGRPLCGAPTRGKCDK